MPEKQYLCKCFWKKKHLCVAATVFCSHLLCVACVCFMLGCPGAHPVSRTSETASPTKRLPKRIVSTVPSITEILFDIGAGELIVGDSSFTKFPPETHAIPKIGGLYDISHEVIVSLKPDLVITLDENSSLRERLKSFDIETMTVDHRSLNGVLASYDVIGHRLGPDFLQLAQKRKTLLSEKLELFAPQKTSAAPVPVLLCVDRIRGTGRIQGLFVAGTNPFFQDVIKLAGGVNVAENIGLAFPSLSAEGIAALAPEVIIELRTSDGGLSDSPANSLGNEKKRQESLEQARREWETLGLEIPAIKNRRVFLIEEDFATIPGPRTPLLVEKLSDLFGEFHRTTQKAYNNDK